MKEQYNKAIAALKELGFHEYPTLEQCQALFTKKQLNYVKKHKGELVITPEVALKDLIKRFDEKQQINTYVYEALWDHYEFPLQWRVDFVLRDAKNNYDEPGLYFTNQTYEEQRKSLATMKKSCAGLDSIDPRTYTMLQTIHREEEKAQIDRSTWTRFVQLDKKRADGDSWVPRARSSDGRVDLRGSSGHANSCDGVRLSVGKYLNLSASAIPSSFSLEEAANSLKQLLEAEYQRGADDFKAKVRELLDDFWAAILDYLGGDQDEQ